MFGQGEVEGMRMQSVAARTGASTIAEGRSEDVRSHGAGAPASNDIRSLPSPGAAHAASPGLSAMEAFPRQRQ